MIIAVISPKGGVGKSTTALNLAVGLRQQFKRVAAVDLDKQQALERFAATNRRISFGSAITPGYDHTVIDCGQYRDKRDLRPLKHSQVALIPIQLKTMDLHAFIASLDSINDMRAENPRLIIRYLISMYIPDQKATKADMQEALGHELCRAIIPKQERLYEAAHQDGKAVIEHAPESRPAKQYQNLIKELLCL